MRFKALDRMISAISGLIILAFGIGLFVFGTGIFPFRLDVSFLDRSFALWQRAVMVAAALALCFFGLRGITLLFRSSKEKGFILQHTEYGDLSISMSAMENMVKKCVDPHEDLKVSGTRIHHARDGVIISLRIALANGVNIPITVSALQKQIKQYITSCSGVDVKEVRVMVETNNSLTAPSAAKTQSTMMADVDAASKAGAVVDTLRETAQNALPPEPAQTESHQKEPFHQRLFKREDKPQIVPQPPVSEPVEAAEAVADTLTAEPEPSETPANEAATPHEETAAATAETPDDDKTGKEEVG
ncbi:MAG TPA: alkaline shock response membrane anchor protein AmaP [Candidatus Limiplasma sp.]|nr:alkaline shock response membrane anchor protein AmaP [Candidatus Limiplasma sp.]